MFDTATISEIALYYLCRSIAFHEFHFMLVMTSTDADQFNFTTLKFNKYSPQLFRCQRCKSIKLRIPNMNFQTNEMGRNERANWRTCLLFSSLLWFAYRHNTLIDSINEKKNVSIRLERMRHNQNLDHFKRKKHRTLKSDTHHSSGCHSLPDFRFHFQTENLFLVTAFAPVDRT